MPAPMKSRSPPQPRQTCLRSLQAAGRGRGENHGEQALPSLASAFDNTRHTMHNPKESAIREVNVADHQEEITGSDELSSLPEEYVLDGYGNRWHPKVEPERVQEGAVKERV